MFNLNKIIKEAKWIGKISLLQEMQMKNMVGQLFAKHKDKFKPEEVSKEKEKFLEFANKINDQVIKNLKVDFKNEKVVLVWILEQIFLNVIDEDRLQEDLEVIKENLEIYFKNKGKINKPLERINYNELKELVKDYKKGGEEEKHQEFLSKPEYEGNGYKIYKITKVDECLKIGKGTSWCIQGEDYAKKYLEEGPLYLVTRNDKRYALLSFETGQFMNINDIPLKTVEKKDIFKIFKKDFIESKIFTLIKLTDEVKFNLELLDDPSEKFQLRLIKLDYRNINYLKNPTEKIKMEVVKDNPFMIHHLENPSKELQLAAVRKSGPTIGLIDNPSEEVQLEAVKKDPKVINNIKNPTQKVLDYVKSLKK